MDQLPAIPQPRHLQGSLDTEHLQKLAELRRAVPEFRRAVRTRALELVLKEIDRAFSEALVDPLLRQGAPPEEVEVAVKQVEAVKEAVKRPLLERLSAAASARLEREREAARIGAERDRRLQPASTPLSEPVRKPVASAVGPIAAKPDRPILPLHGTRV
jgi:hypothetical protein